jgi:hypothetical protein
MLWLRGNSCGLFGRKNSPEAGGQPGVVPLLLHNGGKRPSRARRLRRASEAYTNDGQNLRGYRELRVDLRPLLDAVRRDLVEVPRPLRKGFLAVFLAAVRALVEVFLFDDRLVADADFVLCLVPAARFFVAEVFLFGDLLLVVADADFVFCLVPVARFFAAPITAPETAPITAPATGAPRALPATAPATAPPRVLPAVPFAVSMSNSSPLSLSSSLSSMFLSLVVRYDALPHGAKCQ